MSEQVRTVAVFGGTAELRAEGAARGLGAPASLVVAEAQLHALHAALTRFDPASDLCRLNADPRAVVPAGAALRGLARLVAWAGERTGGLVDATTLDAVEAAGYRASLAGATPPPAAEVVAALGAPRAALPHPGRRWRRVRVDEALGAVRRPPGVRLDGGGLAKGLAADLVAERLAGHAAYAVGCLGDVRDGGTAGRPRTVEVTDPFGGPVVARLTLADGAVATSGITARAFRTADGGIAHHLVDPGRGVPAWTGVVQATAIAPSAVEAEVRAKAAVLSGPAGCPRWLPDGGVLVLADGEVVRVRAAAPRVAAVAA